GVVLCRAADAVAGHHDAFSRAPSPAGANGSDRIPGTAQMPRRRVWARAAAAPAEGSSRADRDRAFSITWPSSPGAAVSRRRTHGSDLTPKHAGSDRCRKSLDGRERSRRANHRGRTAAPTSRSRRHRSWSTKPRARPTEPRHAGAALDRSRHAAEPALLILRRPYAARDGRLDPPGDRA